MITIFEFKSYKNEFLIYYYINCNGKLCVIKLTKTFIKKYVLK